MFLSYWGSQVIVYTFSDAIIGTDGTESEGYICLSPEAYDERIGAIKMALNDYTPGQGWALMNGSNNSAGSAIDMTDKFPRGLGTAAGGADSHIHTQGAGHTYGQNATSFLAKSDVAGTRVVAYDPDHTHDLPAIDSASNVPAYQKFYFYERLDNSA